MDLKLRNKEMNDFFEGKTDEYDEVHLKMMDNKIKITENLNENVKRVLDLGAGTGLELIPLFERFPDAQVVAIDITKSMLEELKKRSYAHNVETICGDFFETDFGNDYDAVISSAALHHFVESDKVKLYKKIYEALKVGGQFINSDRFVDTVLEQRQMMKEYEENRLVKAHIDTPLALEIEEELLESVGFSNIEFIDLKDLNYKLLKAIKKG